MYYLIILIVIQTTLLFSQYIESIEIKGNKNTKDYIILREVRQTINSDLIEQNIIEDKNRIIFLKIYA